MNRKEFTALIEDTMGEVVALNQTKGVEYAGEDDAVSNFKRHGEALDVPPRIIWAVYAGKHWDSIQSYCKTGSVLSEDIEGRVHDLILYLLLLLGLIADESVESPHALVS